VKTYCWKALECELCKMTFPQEVQNPKTNELIDLITFEKPAKEFMILESVTS